MPEEPIGCARPTGARVGEPSASEPTNTIQKEDRMEAVAKVGAKAPDFEAPAYYRGSFTSVKLSEFLGKWVMLCFYPGDFTFV